MNLLLATLTNNHVRTSFMEQLQNRVVLSGADEHLQRWSTTSKQRERMKHLGR